MKSVQYFFVFSLFLSSIYATDVVYATEKKVDCIVLKDENSIICKYSHKRVNKDTTVRFEWVAPNGDISRQRDMIIPAGHGSVYDYRYIKGREIGTWTFKVLDEQEEYKTTFDVE